MRIEKREGKRVRGKNGDRMGGGRGDDERREERKKIEVKRKRK